MHKKKQTKLKKLPNKSLPVTGDDLHHFREQHGLSVMESSALLGLSSTKRWYDTANLGKQPVNDMALAFLLRLYQRHPELLPQYNTDPAVLHERLTELLGNKIPMISFSLLLGRDRSAAGRWSTRDDAGRVIGKLVDALDRLIQLHGMNAVEEYVSIVKQEAAARNADEMVAAADRVLEP